MKPLPGILKTGYINYHAQSPPKIQPVRDEVGMFYLGYKILWRLAHVKQLQ